MIEIINFNKIKLNRHTLKKHNKYFSKYYNDSFRREQGTEQIIDLLSSVKKINTWLDVGAGSTTLFWSLFLKNVKSISCAEVSPEPLKILHDFAISKRIPVCYNDAMNRYKIESTYLAIMRKRIKQYFIFDALTYWPSQLKRFDLITAIGLFGLAKSKKEYVACFKYPKKHLTRKGIFIGANWIRSSKYIKQYGGDNSYLCKNLVKIAAKKYSYTIISLKKITIKNDPFYDAVVLYGLQNE